MKGLPLPITGTGGDPGFTFVGDIVDGLTRAGTPRAIGEEFNLASGRETQIRTSPP